MSSVSVSRHIDASPEAVFDVVATPQRFADAVPDIKRVEILSEVQEGAGVRFRETREIGGREAATELEITEHVRPDRVRIVADSHGSVWDSVFTVSPSGSGSELGLVMDARPYRFLSRITTVLMIPMFRRALEKDMDAVKHYLESGE